MLFGIPLKAWLIGGPIGIAYIASLMFLQYWFSWSRQLRKEEKKAQRAIKA